jgi:hypothetical protein
MSEQIFEKVRSLLKDHVRILNENSIGNEHAEEAEDIIAELDVLIKNKAFIQHIEEEIEAEERKIISDDLADEILNGKYCVGGSCDD